MPAWQDILAQFEATADAEKGTWLNNQHQAALQRLSHLRGERNVLVYASSFLQKPQIPAQVVQITHEDINGFMSVIYGMDCNKGLTLILHTPGGVTNAAETIVAYLRSKFTSIEVIIPAYAMSAGTMISLSADRLIMGRQSQLGPIDPQFLSGSGALSARGIVDQFERAKGEILANQVSAHAWAPVLATIGPALLQEAQNALAYGETMVARWLERYMFAGDPAAAQLAATVAQFFNDASAHKSHGRRIDRDEARSKGLTVEDLEASQALQEEVLTAYHLMTIFFERTLMAKYVASDVGRVWGKNFTPAGP